MYWTTIFFLQVSKHTSLISYQMKQIEYFPMALSYDVLWLLVESRYRLDIFMLTTQFFILHNKIITNHPSSNDSILQSSSNPHNWFIQHDKFIWVEFRSGEIRLLHCIINENRCLTSPCTNPQILSLNMDSLFIWNYSVLSYVHLLQ